MTASGTHSGLHLGEQGFDPGTAGALRLIDGNARPVVGDTHAAVGRQSDVDEGGTAGQNLVHRPVRDLEHHLTQAAFTRRADVHPGPLPNSFPPLQHLDVAGVVPGVFLAHDVPSGDVEQNVPG